MNNNNNMIFFSGFNGIVKFLYINAIKSIVSKNQCERKGGKGNNWHKLSFS